MAQNLLDRGFSYKSPRNIRQYEQTKYCVRMDRVIAGAMDNSDLIPMLKIACLAGEFYIFANYYLDYKVKIVKF